MQIETVILSENVNLGGDYRLLKFASAKIAAQVSPGQFVHLRVTEHNGLILRRPFSVFKADNKSLAILYKIVGGGTALLADMRPGQRVSLIGPLGNGFPAPISGFYPLLVAGGYGAAALYLLAERTTAKGTIFIGGATADDILCADDFERLGWNVRLTTENGSVGRKGLVTDALAKWITTGFVERHCVTLLPHTVRHYNRKSPSPLIEIFACGPMGMLESVATVAMGSDSKAWLSLDRHMGCGVGACLACVQKVRISSDKKAKKDNWKWARICTEGPVFECREIVWE